MKIKRMFNKNWPKFLQILGIINNVFQSTLVQKFSRIRLCNALAVPSLLLGSEIWTPKKKTIKKNWQESRSNFLHEEPVHPFWPQREWRNFGSSESRTSWREANKIQSNWLRHVTRMNNNRMPKIMLNCRPNGRRRLGELWRNYLKRSKWVYQDLIRDGLLLLLLLLSLSSSSSSSLSSSPLFPRQTMSHGIHCCSYSVFVVYGASISISCFGCFVPLR